MGKGWRRASQSRQQGSPSDYPPRRSPRAGRPFARPRFYFPHHIPPPLADAVTVPPPPFFCPEERRKSRRFDEDRKAYGHIRRFIERHAGGRPAEWDEDAPAAAAEARVHGYGDDEEGLFGARAAAAAAAAGGNGTRRQQQLHRQERHSRRGGGGDGARVGGGENARGGVRGSRRTEGVGVVALEESREALLGGKVATRKCGGGGLYAAATVGRESDPCDGGGPKHQHQRQPRSAPGHLRAAAGVGEAPIGRGRTTADTSEYLYANGYRNSVNARFRDSRIVDGSRDAVGGGGAEEAYPLDDDDPSNSYSYSNHRALQFTAGRERTGTVAASGRHGLGNGGHRDPQMALSSRGNGTKPLSDDECGGGDDSAPCNGAGFDSPLRAACGASGTSRATMSPRHGWRAGAGDVDTEAETETSTSIFGEATLERSSAWGRRRNGAGHLGAHERAGGAMGETWRRGGRPAAAASAPPSIASGSKRFGGRWLA